MAGRADELNLPQAAGATARAVRQLIEPTATSATSFAAGRSRLVPMIA
jgi:hypothetical protein